MLSFRRQDHPRVASGEITVSFRLWKSPKVTAGKRYMTGFGTVLIEDLRALPAALVEADDVPHTGCADIPEVWALAGDHTGALVGPDTMLWRVQFRFLGDVPVSSEGKPPLDVETLVERLRRMDGRAGDGPWTFATLRLIDAAPRVPARLLAAELGRETLDFKVGVRKLKALGLTTSHEVGYELTALGQAVLASARNEPRL